MDWRLGKRLFCDCFAPGPIYLSMSDPGSLEWTRMTESEGEPRNALIRAARVIRGFVFPIPGVPFHPVTH